LGIVTRQSTDVLAIDDGIVAAAVRRIREQACDGIKVADVARAAAVTRRVLESRFARRLGHSPHEEILRVRFRRVEQLLRETDLPLATIAERCGFRHTEYMTVAFTRRHGEPPSRWRSRQRGMPPPADGQRTSSSSTRK
jgi:LacI family transcriptional regulator